MPLPEFLTARIVKKTWGFEEIYVSTDDYCSKTLNFTKYGNWASFHFHLNKTETWIVMKGRFNFAYCDEKGVQCCKIIEKGEIVHLEKGTPHLLRAETDDSVIWEVSTKDDPADCVRIEPSMP
jgi:mannose-6-phosphate isomerase-like protein (cupin superfamily)